MKIKCRKIDVEESERIATSLLRVVKVLETDKAITDTLWLTDLETVVDHLLSIVDAIKTNNQNIYDLRDAFNLSEYERKRNLIADENEDATANKIESLEKAERSVLIAAIIHCGSGQHAFPGEDNLNFFTREYAIECLTRAIASSGLTQDGELLATTALAKLK